MDIAAVYGKAMLLIGDPIASTDCGFFDLLSRRYLPETSWSDAQLRRGNERAAQEKEILVTASLY
jgi:hypothetical protein